MKTTTTTNMTSASRPKLTYFDAPVSRGEECRIALHLAGIDFEDVRIAFAQWPALKPESPYGGMPFLELPGHAPIAHANAILELIGRRHGMHPKDDFEAARHLGMMIHVDDLRGAIAPTMRMPEPERKVAREALVATYIPQWGAHAEKNITAEPFFGGASLNVVDIKIFMAVRWLNSGTIDLIPKTILAGYPRLQRIHDAVGDHAGVKAWYART